MSLVYLFKVSGGTRQQYEKAIQILEQDNASAPPGRLYHVAGQMGEELRVIDVWESEEAFNNFLQGNLGKAMQESGIAQPQIEKWEVINIIKGS